MYHCMGEHFQTRDCIAHLQTRDRIVSIAMGTGNPANKNVCLYLFGRSTKSGDLTANGAFFQRRWNLPHTVFGLRENCGRYQKSHSGSSRKFHSRTLVDLSFEIS
jgi:hypothetical protein